VHLSLEIARQTPQRDHCPTQCAGDIWKPLRSHDHQEDHEQQDQFLRSDVEHELFSDQAADPDADRPSSKLFQARASVATATGVLIEAITPPARSTVIANAATEAGVENAS
jgi:hypothetical protein